MIGTPDEVIERLRHYEALGVDEFSLWADNSLTHAEKKRSLELFIEHVVPAFQEQTLPRHADVTSWLLTTRRNCSTPTTRQFPCSRSRTVPLSAEKFEPL